MKRRLGDSATKRVLMIAYHFPPLHGSSGHLRTLKFVRYLLEFGIEPVVLTVKSCPYQAKDDGLLSQVPPNVFVHRAFALDTKRHLAIRGKYFEFLAYPDRFASWIPAGIFAGIRLIHRKKIDVIFSTYPIASAHLIGLALSRITRRPWLADFRDPMWDDYIPLSPKQLEIRKAIESATYRHANQIVVTTAGIQNLFRDRYPLLNGRPITVIMNGYDESDFCGVKLSPHQEGAPVRMVHAGLLDPVDRDPRPFFQGVKRLLDRGNIKPFGLEIDLFASGHEDLYNSELNRLGLTRVIRVCPIIPYNDVLHRMAEADILLLFQGVSCNEEIPAKLFEYLRIGRPILALTSATGETARLIRMTHAGEIVPPDQPEAIASLLAKWVKCIKQDQALPVGDAAIVANFSRRDQTAQLAEIFHQIIREFHH